MLQPGQVLQGRYRIEVLLGQGGMGGVYQALHLELNTRLAIKEMFLEQNDPERRAAAVRQFRMEGQILHGLQHPGLPRVYDFFEADGCYYLAMELIEGQTLHEAVRQHGPCPEATVLAWARQLCEVLAYLHNHDPAVVFRDLKPSNVMLDRSERVRLIDFGIAKIFAPEAGAETGTMARGAGSAGYAPLEQYQGGTNARSDIYSLGATLYYLLTGGSPPDATGLAAGLETLAPIANVSESTEAAIRHMMALRPFDRPATVEEAAQALLSAPPSAVAAPAWRTGQVSGVGAWMGPTAPLVEEDVRTLAVPLPPTPPGPKPIALHVPRRPPSARFWLGALSLVVGVLLLGRLALVLYVRALPGPAPVTGPAPVAVKLSVRSEPAGAEVLLDDQPRGKTPLDLPGLKEGTHSIVRIRQDHYNPETRLVTLEAGDNRVSVTLTPVPDLPGHLTLTAVPRAAALKVDGHAVAAGDVVSVSPGTHHLEAACVGYQSRSRDVVCHSDQSQKVSFTLLPVDSLPLINVAFRDPRDPHKVGPAVIGNGPKDFWNDFTSTTPRPFAAIDLRSADGQPSGVRLDILASLLFDKNGMSDAMGGAYAYPLGTKDIHLMLSGLSPGSYVLFVYGHGPKAEDTSSYWVVVTGEGVVSGRHYPEVKDLGTQTTHGSGWEKGWQEGVQYVVYPDVDIAQGTTLEVNVHAKEGPYPYLSGLQLQRKP